MPSLDSFLEIIGWGLPRAEASRLLEELGGDVNAAVAAHFSGTIRLPRDMSALANPSLDTLRCVLGPGVPQDQLRQLLKLSGGSVEAAINLYLENPHAGRTSTGNGAGGSGAGPPGSPHGGRGLTGPRTGQAVADRNGATDRTANGDAAGGSPCRSRQRNAARTPGSPGPVLRADREGAVAMRATTGGPLMARSAAGAAEAAAGGASDSGTGVAAPPAATTGSAGGAVRMAANAEPGGSRAGPPLANDAHPAPNSNGVSAAGPADGHDSAQLLPRLPREHAAEQESRPYGGAGEHGNGVVPAAATAGAANGHGLAQLSSWRPRVKMTARRCMTTNVTERAERTERAGAAANGAAPAGAGSDSAGKGAAGTASTGATVAGSNTANAARAGAAAGAAAAAATRALGGAVAAAMCAAGGGAAATATGNARRTGAAPSSTQQASPAGPQPLLNFRLIAGAKRTQGPYPVAPLLPLPQFRRPDGSLFVADQDTVPGRSPPVQPLSDFPSPMLLGSVMTPLMFDTYPTDTWNFSLITPPEVQRALLCKALAWLQEGKLKYGAAHRCNRLFWRVDALPGSRRLVFVVESREFLHAALQKFPDVETLKTAVAGFGVPAVRLAATAANGPLERLMRLYERDMAADLHVDRNTSVLLNIGILGPGLDGRGVLLRVDVAASELGSSGRASAGARSTKAKGAAEGQGSDSGGDGAGADDGGGSDSDHESDALGTQLTGRKRARGHAGRGPHAQPAADVAAKARAPTESARSGKAKGSSKGTAAAVRDEDKEGIDSPRPRKRARRPKGSAAACAGSKRARGKKCVGAAVGTSSGGGGVLPGQAAAGGGDVPERVVDFTALSGRNQQLAHIGFHLCLQFYITEESLQVAAPHASWGNDGSPHAEGSKARKARRYNGAGAEYLVNVIHVLLEHGIGLYVGPDCDGAINTMDVDGLEPRGGDAHGSGWRPCSQVAPAAGTSMAAAGSRATSSAAGASGSGGGTIGRGVAVVGDEQHGEEGVRDLDSLLDSIQPPSDLPPAMVPPAVIAHPKPFQLQGLEWMVRRERRGDAIGRSLLLLHPAFVQVVVGSTGLVLHMHRLAPYYVSPDFFPAPVGGTCGGFLCDEMGLGKSLQTLMLLVSNPPPLDWPATPVPYIARGVGGGGEAAIMTALVEEGDKEPIPIQTTLLVTPANLQSQWVEEIHRHIQPGSLKWAIYHGREDSQRLSTADPSAGSDAASFEAGFRPRRRLAREVQQRTVHMSCSGQSCKAGEILPPILARDGQGSMVPMHACDIVLVSYEVLRKELAVMGPNSRLSLQRLGFWRIVLDEAQLVANSNSVAAEVVSSLYRRHAWVVTGTPISSNLDEVRGLCEFLCCEPFYHSVMWRNLIHQPYTQQGTMGVAALRALLRGVMLRRSKAAVEDQLALPPCVLQDLEVELNGVERAYYEVVKRRFLSALHDMPAEERRRPNSGNQRANKALVELRQCCCHPQIVRREAAAAPGLQRSAGGADGVGGQGPARLTMRQIMAKLISEAYGAYDQAVAALYASRLQQAALVDYRAGADAGRCGCGAGDSERASHAGGGGGDAGGGGGGDGGGNPGGDAGGGQAPSLGALVDSIRQVTKLVSEPDVLHQAKVRQCDGTVNWEQAKETMAFGDVAGGLAAVSLPVAIEQAKDRKRRWMRLELDGCMLRIYIACLLAPRGTLELLASQANVRATAAAREEAVARAERAADGVAYRQAALVEAQAGHSAAMQAAAGAEAAAGPEAAAETASAEAGVDMEATATVAASVAAAAEVEEVEERKKKAKERLHAAIRAVADAEGSAAAARQAAEVAAAVAESALAAVTAAATEAPEDVALAAAQIDRLNEKVMELRAKLGLEHCDLTLAGTELRRSSRQVQAAGGAAAGAGPSQPAATAGGFALGDADFESEDEWRDSDDSSCGADRRRKGKRKCRAAAGGSRHASVASKKRRLNDGSGGTAGLLLTLGGTQYQEAVFRSEPAIRTFQQGTSRAAKGSEPAASDARLLASVKEKWHALQHLLNQQENLGMAGDDKASQAQAAANGSGPSSSDAKGDDDGAAAAEAAGPSHSNPVAAGPSHSKPVAAGPSGSNPVAAGPSGSNSGPPQSHELLLQQQRISHQLVQLLQQQDKQKQLGAQGKGLGCGSATSQGAGGSAARKAEFSCPICLDSCPQTTITKCGHTFCTDCIHDIVQDKGTAPCPICRRQLRRDDLFDSVREEEAEPDVLAGNAAEDVLVGNAEYGAKVAALLVELARMSEADPGSKALVFSSWGRLLRLVQEALQTNCVRCVSMVGGNPATRQAALQSFLHDPSCRVLLLMKSTSGGAAGLTLTAAHTAFILEPALNPGLEAQAAARICRLGQDRPTRVVRIITRSTVEERVLALQHHKQQLGGDSAAAAAAATEAVDGSLLTRFFSNL